MNTHFQHNMQLVLSLFECQISYIPSLLSNAGLINNSVKPCTFREIHCDFPSPGSVHIVSVGFHSCLIITDDRRHHHTVEKQRAKLTAKLLQLRK